MGAKRQGMAESHVQHTAVDVDAFIKGSRLHASGTDQKQSVPKSLMAASARLARRFCLITLSVPNIRKSPL